MADLGILRGCRPDHELLESPTRVLRALPLDLAHAVGEMSIRSWTHSVNQIGIDVRAQVVWRSVCVAVRVTNLCGELLADRPRVGRAMKVPVAARTRVRNDACRNLIVETIYPLSHGPSTEGLIGVGVRQPTRGR